MCKLSFLLCQSLKYYFLIHACISGLVHPRMIKSCLSLTSHVINVDAGTCRSNIARGQTWWRVIESANEETKFFVSPATRVKISDRFVYYRLVWVYNIHGHGFTDKLVWPKYKCLHIIWYLSFIFLVSFIPNFVQICQKFIRKRHFDSHCLEAGEGARQVDSCLEHVALSTFTRRCSRPGSGSTALYPGTG